MQRAFDTTLEGLLGDWRGAVLLAVSGGIDSMTMLHLARHSALNLDFAVAHVNFSLRPGDCDKDQALVHDTCRQAGIPFYTKKFDTAAYASGKGISIEMAARELRYGWFSSLMEKHGYGYLLVAHNQNDCAETMMLNLLRGTGLRGMCGIRETNGNIIRPMLGFSRADIEAFAAENSISFRDDSTNSDVEISRNRLRHNVFPEFEKINPSFLNTFSSEAGHFAQAETILDELFADKRTVLCTSEGDAECISIEALKREPHRDYWMFRLLAPCGFTQAQIESALAAIDAQSGKEFCSATHRLLKDREHFKIYPLADAPLSHIEVTIFDRTVDFDPRKHPLDVLYADADTLHLPLKVRPWRSGDRFRPLGMQTSRLISDFFTDLKLDLEQKRRAGIVFFEDPDGEHIVAIAGIPSPRLDDRYRITSSTKRIASIGLK